jgi:hypothetical protein
LRISSPQNLAKFDRLVEINRRLADPRGLSESEPQALAAEGKPFYLVYATIHSTEVSNGQAILTIVHRLATENSPFIKEILDNSVILLVPSQNPDGQHLVIDHWYKTKGTNNARVYPDLDHKYVGHDDNRDWFMFTQKETRMNIELVPTSIACTATGWPPTKVPTRSSSPPRSAISSPPTRCSRSWSSPTWRFTAPRPPLPPTAGSIRLGRM